MRSGDYPLLIAERFRTSIEDLAAANNWRSVDEFPAPGTNIVIPPPPATDLDTTCPTS